jgi:hypothetical protein
VVLLDARALVVDVQGGNHAIGDHAGAETAGSGLDDLTVKDQLYLFGPPDIQVLADDILEENAPADRTIAVNMASLKAPASAKWFDPTNGTYTTIPGGPFANAGTREFTPPGYKHDGESDWVLLLNASASTP